MLKEKVVKDILLFALQIVISFSSTYYFLCKYNYLTDCCSSHVGVC